MKLSLTKTRLNSVTRLSLLILVGGLLYMEIKGIDISDVYSGVLMTVVGFFFGQRSAEHKSFEAKNEIEELKTKTSEVITIDNRAADHVDMLQDQIDLTSNQS